ncbi:MAG TPA: hypothetical protein VMM55_10140 [Thermohalobaculum sp.]|nr:hypothetical protein [Thermohalobaculum sp.]
MALCWEHDRSDNGTVRLVWTELGGPQVREPDRPGFGLEFIQQSTEYELRGKCRAEFGPEGFSCTFELPAAALGRPRDGSDG